MQVMQYLIASLLLTSLRSHSRPKKVQAITDFPMVSSQSVILEFLGMVGFYRHHIQANLAQRTNHVNFSKGQNVPSDRAGRSIIH